VPDAPDTIVLKRHRDLDGRRNEIWIRRGLFALLCVLPVLALLDVFGQRPSSTTATADAAVLDVYAPHHVRGGLIFEARFHVTARRALRHAVLVLDPGWLEGMTVNTIEPSPVSEGSDDGRLTLTLGQIPQGTSHLLFVQFQVDPTNVGRRSQTVDLYDGDQRLATVHRTVTVFP
jgi:hypothetical protein